MNNGIFLAKSVTKKLDHNKDLMVKFLLLESLIPDVKILSLARHMPVRWISLM